MALYLKKELKNGATIGVWELKESEQELLSKLEIPSDELFDIFICKSEQLRREKLAVLALIAELFGEVMYLGHHENGSPYIENDATHISISHTNRFVAVILHPTEDVGIDIESLTRDFSAVYKRAIGPEEMGDIIDDDSEEKKGERNSQLALYWCAKEALFKRMELNSVVFAEDIVVEQFNLHTEGEIKATFKYPNEGEDGREESFNLEYEFFADHVMVWVVA